MRSISLGEHRGAAIGAVVRSCAVRRNPLGEHKEPRLMRIFAHVGIFTKIYIKNSPPHSEKAQKESSGPFAVGYSEKTPGTAVQRTQAFPRPTANGSCGGSIPQNACFGIEWKG